MIPNVQQGCEDCDLVTNHRTKTRAVAAILAHVAETAHWPLIADNNGWHRIWPKDGVPLP
jgi:hypothetical protein